MMAPRKATPQSRMQMTRESKAADQHQRRPPGPAEDQSQSGDNETDGGQQPEQAEEAHARRAQLQPAREQGGFVGQLGDFRQRPVGDEAHQVDQAVNSNRDRKG